VFNICWRVFKGNSFFSVLQIGCPNSVQPFKAGELHELIEYFCGPVEQKLDAEKEIGKSYEYYVFNFRK
jgi:hypothetical protein